MPRLIRRRPLKERILAALNPWDFFLWLSEEIETRDLGSKSLGTQLGVGLNFLFLLARANGAYSSRKHDDVFGDADGSGWLAYVSWTLAWLLACLSVCNIAHTFWRTRPYRFFEQDVEKPAATPNAQRVRVQSSPASSSPLRILSDLLSSESAESRAHPDKSRDVWELHLWDPLPASLQLVCLFSPVHILIYMLALPLAPLDARPSVTVFKCLAEQVALSALLLALEAKFSQLNKDSRTIQQEVMREYDHKYVRPRLHPTVREAGTQCGEDEDGNQVEFVVLGTPTTQIVRSFRPNPNPNYLAHIDPDSTGRASVGRSTPPSRAESPTFTPTPMNRLVNRPVRQTGEFSMAPKARPSPLRQSLPAIPVPVQPASPEKPTMSNAGTSTGSSYGGSLGVFSHPRSPLKKAASITDMQQANPFSSPRNSRELAAIEQRDLAERMVRKSSPVKHGRHSGLASNMPQFDGTASPEPESSPNPFANMGRHRSRYERFPSRF